MIDILIDIIREKGRFPQPFVFCWDIDIGHRSITVETIEMLTEDSSIFPEYSFGIKGTQSFLLT